jgi:copper chaperone NosL
LNFTAFSGPDTGGWIFLFSGILVFACVTFEIYRARPGKKLATVAVVLVLSIGMFSCSVKPEPLQYGKDACHHCKMVLMDDKFGAEIVSAKGKIFKFDDVSCLMSFINSAHLDGKEIAQCMIVDFASPGALIDARSAFYVKASAIKSPMAGNIAAFHDEATRNSYNQSWKGEELSWNELLIQTKR